MYTHQALLDDRPFDDSEGGRVSPACHLLRFLGPDQPLGACPAYAGEGTDPRHVGVVGVAFARASSISSDAQRLRAQAALIRADAVRVRHQAALARDETARNSGRGQDLLRTLHALTADLQGIAGGAQTHSADLTARAAFHQLEQSRMEAERAEEKAVDTVRAKDHFLAVLGHDLRTPLTPILMITSALLDDPATPDKLRGHLEVILRNLKQETRLIDDLLDLQRVSHGKLRLRREVVEAHKLIGQALETDRSTLRDAGIEVVVDLRAPESLLEADSARLLQIIGNLIQNAAKFTPEGGTLTVSTRTEGAPGDRRWVAEFADTGAGIESDLLPRIFDAFVQGQAGAQGRTQGLGLGLAICRSLVEAHGGRLTATSPGRGQGTTFTLEFPTVSTPVVESEPATPSKAAAPCRGLKVLLVEDHADIMRYLAMVLRGRDHEVTTAATLAAARAAAAVEAFDLLVSDIELPDGTGLELMRELGGSRRVTGIACSGFGSVEDVEQSREAGFAAHLTKPIEVRLLEETINRVVPAASGVGSGA